MDGRMRISLIAGRILIALVSSIIVAIEGGGVTFISRSVGSLSFSVSRSKKSNFSLAHGLVDIGQVVPLLLRNSFNGRTIVWIAADNPQLHR